MGGASRSRFAIRGRARHCPEAASSGALKIELYPDGALGANGQTFDRVDAGVAEIGWDIPLVYGQRFASLTVVGLPFMFDDTEAAAASDETDAPADEADADDPAAEDAATTEES